MLRRATVAFVVLWSPGCVDGTGKGDLECDADNCYAGEGAIPTGVDGSDYRFEPRSYACERVRGDTPISRGFQVSSHHVFPDFVTDDGTSITYDAIEDNWNSAVDGILTTDGSGAAIGIGTTFVTDVLDADDPLINAVFMSEGLAYPDAPDDTLGRASCTPDEESSCLNYDCDIIIPTDANFDEATDTVIPFTSNNESDVNYLSLAVIFEHELGHALGLNDQDYSAFPDTIMQEAYWDASTAWPFYAASADDQQALAWIYGR